MNKEHLFSFTPSMMSSRTLEQLFVQRKPLAQRLEDLTRESVLTDNKHHFLILGPRGMGKSHLIALLYHRINAMSDLTNKICIAWLREDEWGVDSFLVLLQRIFRALQEEYPDTFPNERFEDLYNHSPDAAERLAVNLLTEFVGSRTLFLIIENLDDLFKGIGDIGQRRWRAFLQETSLTTVLATSQSLFTGVTRHNSPFYGFFHTYSLDEFTVDDATELLEKIAVFNNDDDLARFLNMPAGRARVRAINHLAGGNPRVYVIFSEFLTRASLDTLVDPFLGALDELTPYYQARLSYLSSQQRKIVDYLCERGAPATVKEIAQRCFVSSQSISSQLKELKEKGYVYADPLGPTGRDTYYELREPLLRMSLEVKKSRGGPIRLLIEFLRLWYPVTELRQQLDLCDSSTPVEREYLSRALALAETSPDPIIEAWFEEYDKYFDLRDYESALRVVDELIEYSHSPLSYAESGVCLVFLNRYEEALERFSISLAEDSSSAYAWMFQGNALYSLERYDEALDSYERAAELEEENPEIWHNFADVYISQKNYKDAAKVLQKVVKIDPKNVKGWQKLGESFYYSGKYGDASKIFRKITKLGVISEELSLWQYRVAVQMDIPSEAVQFLEEAIQIGQTGVPHYVMGVYMTEKSDYVEALAHFDASIKIDAGRRIKSICAYFNRAEVLIVLQSFSKALKSLEESFELAEIDEQHVLKHTNGIIKTLMLSTRTAEDWTVQIQKLVELYLKKNIVNVLGTSLVNNISFIESPQISPALSTIWLEAWKVAGKNIPEISLSLRLLETATRFINSKDVRVLLELPIEMRRVLEKQLKLDHRPTLETAEVNK